MIRMTSEQLSECLQVEVMPAHPFEFEGVEIDSRKDCSRRLFVAIRGDNFDGHDFISAAAEKGAVAVLVEREVDVDIPQIVVGDGRRALADLARYWRLSLDVRLVAITGSNGKTTVKEMLGHILRASQPVLMTAGNLNNDIGVPLTLFRLSSEHRYAVIEMGANHVGEIRQLVAIAEPDIVYVNNAQQAHVGGFGSLEKVIEAKGEMYAHSTADALAVFNDDEASASTWKQRAAAKRHSCFSMQHPTDVQGHYEMTDTGLRLDVQAKGDRATAVLDVFGRHNAQNALAALTLARACGIRLEDAAAALTGFSGVRGRQEFKRGAQNCRIIDDSYNANPDSLAAAIDVVGAMSGEAWLALGDMAELGQQAQTLHDEALSYALDKGFEQCFALGEKSCQAVRLFGRKGHCFDSHREMADFISTRLHERVNLLVKGSRSAGMDKLVDLLLASNQPVAQSGGYHAV